jgi:hypothetical protein
MAQHSSMRLRVVMTAAGMVLLAGSALAQSSGAQSPAMPGGGGGLGGTPSVAPRAQPPAPDPLSLEDVSRIKGAAVYDSNDNKVGNVSTILMKPESRTIDRLVVGEGGVLGFGSHNVALPVDAFSWDSQKAGFKITKTADDLKSMPEWQQQMSQAPASGAQRAPRAGGMVTPPADGSDTHDQ